MQHEHYTMHNPISPYSNHCQLAESEKKIYSQDEVANLISEQLAAEQRWSEQLAAEQRRFAQAILEQEKRHKEELDMFIRRQAENDAYMKLCFGALFKATGLKSHFNVSNPTSLLLILQVSIIM